MTELKIKPLANLHGIFLIVVGSCCLLILTVVANFWWQDHKFVLLLAILVSIVTLFIGIIKKLEPQYSYLLSPTAVNYHHKYGHWNINWCDIQLIAQIKLSKGLTSVSLPYLGIKLKNNAPIETIITPRLASRLIHEQRPLIITAIENKLITMEEAQLSFLPYKLGNGRTIKGPIASFLHHTMVLQQAYGYHLYLPSSSFDRPLEDFLALVKACQQHALSVPLDD